MISSRTTKLLVAALSLLVSVPAVAADRWQEAGSGAVAILPNPQPANGILSGSLYCAEQKWAFQFRTGPGALQAGETLPAKVTISGQVLELEARTGMGTARVAIPTSAIQPLKDGTRLAVEIGPAETGVAAVFNLRGSKLAIDAVAPKCSQIDMSKFKLVSLSETDPAVEQAKQLVADEMALFRAATNKEPTVSATALELGEQKKLMFAAVCGSTNYYGASGCNLTGYAQTAPADGWRQVYNTEGIVLHTDPEVSNGGWPNLVTLPAVNGLEPTHWVWAGDIYELRDVVMAGDEKTQEEGDSGN